ncbi:hypothetical protein FJZ36_04335 [Candidatus Poribacteria bacterium]|nr:hypothetical protein [Candidatus Poribacteria bacterium]
MIAPRSPWLLHVLACVAAAWLAHGAHGEGSRAWWVFLRSPLDSSSIAAVERTGATIRTRSEWFRTISVEADDASLRALERLPFVERAEPVASFVRALPGAEPASAPALALEATSFQLAFVGADRLHERGLTGKGVRIGVLDTGFDTSHVALRSARIGGTYDAIHSDDVVHDEPGQDDAFEDSHGTQVLSILAGKARGEFDGVAPDAEYFLAKTEDVTRNGRTFESVIEEDYWVAGLEWCVKNGCRVVNSSVGYPLFYAFNQLDGKTSLVSRAANEAAARGTLVVCAAGNTDGLPPRDNTTAGRVGPPADSPHVLAVGNAAPDGTASRFSAQGPTFDGRIKPDVMALGTQVAVVSAFDAVSYARTAGTSVASPFATGVVALLLQAFPLATPAEVAAAIRATASNAVKPNNRSGFGVIDAEAAWSALADRHAPTDVDAEAETFPTTLGHLRATSRYGSLGAPYPNPATDVVAASITMAREAAVRVCVFDGLGRRVCVLSETSLGVGRHAIPWRGVDLDGLPVPSGIYFVVLSLPDARLVRRILWRAR